MTAAAGLCKNSPANELHWIEFETTGTILYPNPVRRHVDPIDDTHTVSAKVEFIQYSVKKLLAWIFSALSDIDIRVRATSFARVREHVCSDFLAVSLFS